MTETAPLLATASAPVPAGGRAEWFHGTGGVRLRAALFPAKGTPIGSVVLSSGRTEAIEKYFETVEDLRSRGLTVLVQEWRGQGLSHRELKDRLAGHANGYQAFLSDYHTLLAHFGPRLPKPWYAIGHSMGGCLTLLALAHGEAKQFEASKDLLEKVEKSATWSGEWLRVWRVIQVLEGIGTPEAQAVLHKLAEGTPASRLTAEAKASAQRLAKRAAAAP